VKRPRRVNRLSSIIWAATAGWVATIPMRPALPRLLCCWLFALAALTFASGPLAAAERAKLPGGVRRVVFVGDSITYGGNYVSAFAGYFATRYPDLSLEIINVGLSSETVSGLSEDGHAGGKFPRPDLHERLGRVLAQTKPDLVFACYGMNDGIYLPFADERLQKFKDGIAWLHDQVVASGARIIHVTPPVYDDARGGRPPGYGAVLGRYAAWLVSQRKDARWSVVDVHTPMQRALERGRARDPEFYLSKDGVHPGEAGHWIMAQEILRHLGARDVSGAQSATDMVKDFPYGPKVLALVAQRHLLMRDAWLTATGHTRPGVKAGLPLATARAQAAAIDDQLTLMR